MLGDLIGKILVAVNRGLSGAQRIFLYGFSENLIVLVFSIKNSGNLRLLANVSVLVTYWQKFERRLIEGLKNFFIWFF